MSKCPHCDATLGSVAIHPVTARKGTQTLPCISLDCPTCQKSLSITVDPYKLIEEMKKQLR